MDKYSVVVQGRQYPNILNYAWYKKVNADTIDLIKPTDYIIQMGPTQIDDTQPHNDYFTMRFIPIISVNNRQVVLSDYNGYTTLKWQHEGYPDTPKTELQLCMKRNARSTITAYYYATELPTSVMGYELVVDNSALRRT